MKRLLLAALAFCPLVFGGLGVSLPMMACSGGSGGTGGTGGGRGGGSGGSGGSAGERYTITTLDPASTGDRGFIAMAVDPSQNRVGVIYLVGQGYVDDGGATPNYQWKYVEWKDGQVSTPEVVTTVKRFVGVDLAFQANGQPIATYLGGGADMSAYWFQSDAVLNRRSANGTWTEEIVVSDGNMALCPAPNPVSNIVGIVEGLWPAVLVNGSTEYLWYRDGHNAEFPLQDWAGSDVELAKGGPSSWQHICVLPGGNDKGAWGGHIKAVFGDSDRPAIIYDKMPGGADAVGNNVYFQYEMGDGTWSTSRQVISVAATQTGASLAWDPQAKFGVAVLSGTENILSYTHTTNYGQIWSTADQLDVTSGTTGWYPSLAYDPSTHEPAIAYYHCSNQNGATESTCRPEDDKLIIAQRNSASNRWNEELVDSSGGSIPQLKFLASGKRAIAYRARGTNVVQLAIEK